MLSFGSITNPYPYIYINQNQATPNSDGSENKMATTPPASAMMETPPAPRHPGDVGRHYSTRTKPSKTCVARNRTAITPPPGRTHYRHQHTPEKTPRATVPPPHSPPQSATPPSPRKHDLSKKRDSNHSEMKKRLSGARPDAQHLSSPDTTINGNSADRGSERRNPAHTLPTPASIPRKKVVPHGVINAAARVLFPSRPETIEEAMPTPRRAKKNRRHVGFSLYGSMDGPVPQDDGQIEIYTDSKDKIPELDESEDNPFLERPQRGPPVPEPSKLHASRKRKTGHGVASNARIEDAFNQEEGIVYVFRGKKIYRKFPKESDSESDEHSTAGNGDLNASDGIGMSTPRHLTRASVKPRLLFPTAQQQAERDATAWEDEEAPTDIDDDEIARPVIAQTPKKQRFEPATPPTTGRATRSTAKKTRDSTTSPSDSNSKLADSPKNRRKGISPFDAWSRTKPGTSADPLGRKREAAETEIVTSKRLKGSILNSTGTL